MTVVIQGAELVGLITDNITERDALTKFEAMTVYVTANNATYRLRSDLVTWDEITQNSNVILAQQIFS